MTQKKKSSINFDCLAVTDVKVTAKSPTEAYENF